MFGFGASALKTLAQAIGRSRNPDGDDFPSVSRERRVRRHRIRVYASSPPQRRR